MPFQTQSILTEREAMFPRSFGRLIVRPFEKTPPSIVCPHFWELNWAYGCPFDCAYCYLQGTFRGNKQPRHKKLSRVLSALGKVFENDKLEPTIFNSGELTDSLAFPSVMEKIADKFEEQNKHKLLLLTKSANVGFLVRKPRRQTIYSFSLNATEVGRRWEHKTAPPEKRINAAKRVMEAGYEVRVRIDPIFPIERWKKHYEDIIYLLFSELPQDPDRITLGTPRGLMKTRMYAKDLSWWKVAFEENPSEDSGWGKKIALPLRKEIYTFFYDKLAELGFDKSRIAMCKETISMWKELGLDYTKCKCNCVW